MKEHFSGQVRAGKLVIDQPLKWSSVLARQDGKRLSITIEREVVRRTLEHNARYWALLVPLAGHLLSATRDIPLSKKQVHYVLACSFGGGETSQLGPPIPAETHLFSKERFHTYCTEIEAWLSQAGYPIPEMGDMLESASL